MARRRFLGVSLEAAAYGTDTALAYYVDIASASLDTPDSPELIHPGGLNRFKKNHQSGMYIPTGNIEFPMEITTFGHLLEMALGGTVTYTDNTTAVLAESIGTASGTTHTATLGTVPVIPGSVTIQTDAPADVATDDGFGTLVQANASGMAGTINYTTGAISITGAVDSTNYEADYSEVNTAGFHNMVIIPSVTDEQKDVTMSLGKDQLMHTFLGCVNNGVSIAIEKEWVMVTLDVISQKDLSETIATEATVLAKMPRPEHGGGNYIPFHKVTAKMVDYGGSLADISTRLEALTVNINNGGDGESGVTLGSRHPRRQFLGEAEISGDMTLVFDGENELDDFWGADGAPAANGTTEKAIEVTIASPDSIGSIVLSFPKALFQQVAVQGSGRERIVQELKWEAIYDDSVSYILQATVNSLKNWESHS